MSKMEKYIQRKSQKNPSALSVVDLKELCLASGIPVSGTKAELWSRLVEIWQTEDQWEKKLPLLTATRGQTGFLLSACLTKKCPKTPNGWSALELKEACRACQLKVGGNKAALCRRLGTSTQTAAHTLFRTGLDARLQTNVLTRQKLARLVRLTAPERQQLVALTSLPATTSVYSSQQVAVSGKDLSTLQPGQWLNNEVINAYMELLQAKYPRCKFLLTDFSLKLFSPNSARIHKWSKAAKENMVDDFDKVFIPVHTMNGAHWCVVCANFQTETFEYYDSLGGVADSACFHALAQYFQEESRLYQSQRQYVFNEWLKLNVHTPMQKNNVDCGVFMCQYIHFAACDLPRLFTGRHMPQLRKRMMLSIASRNV